MLSSRVEVTDIPMCLTWDVSDWVHAPVVGHERVGARRENGEGCVVQVKNIITEYIC